MNIDPSNKRRAASADAALLRSILAENSIKKPCLHQSCECSCSRAGSAQPFTGASCEPKESGCCPVSSQNGVSGKALGMVYSPIQCWQKLYDAETGFSKGTIFAELDLPFEATSKGGKCGG